MSSHRPKYPPLCIAELRIIQDTSKDQHVRRLLWEIKRLHGLLIEMDWYVGEMQRRQREAGQQDAATERAANVLAMDPTVYAERARREEREKHQAAKRDSALPAWGIGHRPQIRTTSTIQGPTRGNGGATESGKGSTLKTRQSSGLDCQG